MFAGFLICYNLTNQLTDFELNHNIYGFERIVRYYVQYALFASMHT